MAIPAPVAAPKHPLYSMPTSEVNLVAPALAADANDLFPRLTAPLETALRPTPYLPTLGGVGAAAPATPLSVACMRTLTVSKG